MRRLMSSCQLLFVVSPICSPVSNLIWNSTSNIFSTSFPVCPLLCGIHPSSISSLPLSLKSSSTLALSSSVLVDGRQSRVVGPSSSAVNAIVQSTHTESRS
ncbi:hypothetical protein Droror1_Dr00001888 [Drosera rotundifolia]